MIFNTDATGGKANGGAQGEGGEQAGGCPGR